MSFARSRCADREFGSLISGTSLPRRYWPYVQHRRDASAGDRWPELSPERARVGAAGLLSEGEELVDVVQDWGCWISSFLRKVSSGFCPRTYSVGPKLRDSVFS